VTAAWVTALCGLVTIIGVLLRLSFQVGSLVQRLGDHVTSSDRTHADQETRLRRLESARARR
jgi:hypothetical protein